MHLILSCSLSCTCDVCFDIFYSLKLLLATKVRQQGRRPFGWGTIPSILSMIKCKFPAADMFIIILSTFIIVNVLVSVYRKQFFAQIGEVVDVRLATHEDGHPKGFGHVEFATAEDAQKVNVSVLLPQLILVDVFQC